MWKRAAPDGFLANCESYQKKEPSAISITAIEDAVILRINTRTLDRLYEKDVNLLHVKLKLYQELVEQMSEHQYILSLKMPVQRYRYLLECRPKVVQRISLTNIGAAGLPGVASVSVPAFVTPHGNVLHINIGTSMADVKG